MSPPLIIAHDNCVDGFTAAWIAERSLSQERRVAPEVLFVSYGSEPPDVRGRDVYVLDFSYPRETMIRMHEEARSLVVLDHHKTAAEALEGLDFATFDMDKSGAMLAWEHFYPNSPPTRLVEYVMDRDLWLNERENTRAATAHIQSTEKTMSNWDQLQFAYSFDSVVVPSGWAILRYRAQLVESILQDVKVFAVVTGATDGELEFESIGVVSAPGMLASDVCHAILGRSFDGRGPVTIAAAHYTLNDERLKFSLRSKNGEGPDVAKIAKKFGGGGHKHASGFVYHIVPWISVEQVKRRRSEAERE